MNIEWVQISTTCDDRSILTSIANSLIESKLAGCCQLEGPIESTYCWQGTLETETEYRLTIKTRRQLFKAVRKIIIQQHSYDQPQLVATPIVECDAGYAAWLQQNTRSVER